MSEHLATASVLIVPDTTKFRALLAAELTAATAATGSLGAASAATAKAVTVEAGALQLAGASAVSEARANRVSAVAAAESARAHEQLARGAGATSLSLLGIRGATLAASKNFLLGAAAVTILAKSVKESSKEAEAAARVQKILGPALAASSEEWAKQQAAIGLSTTAALKFEGAIAEVFHNVGTSAEQTQQFSERLVRLSEDVAAFNNVHPEEVLRAFQLGLSGNLRGLRQFVPGVTAARVALQAMQDTGKNVKANLTDQELTVARYEVILQAASNQVGSLKDRQYSLAVQTKVLTSNLANLGATIGGPLAHSITGLLIGLNATISGLKRLDGAVHDATTGAAEAVARFFGFKGSIDKTNESLGDVPGVAGPAGVSLAGVGQSAAGAAGGVNSLGGAVAGLVGPMNAARQAALDLQAAVAGLGVANTALLRLQAEGAPLTKQLGAAQTALAKAAAAARAADRLAPEKGKATTQKQALQAELQARGQVTSLQGQIAAQAKASVGAAVKAGKSAQELLDEQDQRLAVEQGLAQGAVSIKQALAERTKSLVDDLSAARGQVVLLGQQVVQAAKIHDLTTRLQTIQQLTLARIQAQDTITRIREEQAQRKKDRANLLRDRAEQRLELNIEIADTNKNIRAEIAARNARISLDREQLKSVHGDIVRRKQLQLQIAQDTQAIKDLKKQQEGKNDAFRSLTFSFLQAQQGFAANLLSNLLPSGAASGAVGGRVASVAPSRPAPPLGPGTALGRDGAVAAGAAGGATRGQMAMLIQINQSILSSIVKLVGTQKHPEARNQRVAASADMAYGNAGN